MKTGSKPTNIEELNSDFKPVFEEAKRRMFDAYSSDETPAQKKARLHSVDELFKQRVKVTCSTKCKSQCISASLGLSPPADLKYEIKVKKDGWAKTKFWPYLSISKSTLGMNDDGEVENEVLYRQSGLGLFAEKDFEEGEYIGLFMGDIKVDEEGGYESPYAMKWVDEDGRDHVVDPKGSFFYPVYFGAHLMNDPKSRNKVNVKIDANLRLIALKKIAKGDELFVSYGKDYWTSMSKHI